MKRVAVMPTGTLSAVLTLLSNVIGNRDANIATIKINMLDV
jgi:hypothetical protein